MKITLDKIKPVNGKWFIASFHKPSMTFRITARNNKFFYYLPLFSACDQPGKRDYNKKLYGFLCNKSGEVTVITYLEKCSLWDLKEYTIEISPDTIKYYYRVYGTGRVDTCYLGRGWMKGSDYIEEEMGAIPGFDTVFSPLPNFSEQNYYFAGASASIAVNDNCNGNAQWGNAFTCAPFCYSLNNKGDKLWVYAGAAVKPGSYTFEQFDYNDNATKRIFGAGGLSCKYNGKLVINGVWESPHLVLGAGNDEYSCIENYIKMLEKDYELKLQRKREIPDWWNKPIFCGWGEQMSLSLKDYGCVEKPKKPAADYCTDKLHDKWLNILHKKRIFPGTIIIDAKWQEKNGDSSTVDKKKWKDLRGWIDKCHKNNIRVLLWMNSWDKEGVPEDECIKRKGKPVTIDPTNPAYEARLRNMIHFMISSESGCLNADGLKVDGSLTCPIGPDVINYRNLWGLELQRHYMKIIHDEAKRNKQDAVVGLFFSNPYISDLCDMGRAADMFTIKGSPESSLLHRAKVFRIGMPGCLFDTDHQFLYEKRENWIDIMETQVKTGIPCLYHAEYVSHFRPFTIPYIDKMNGNQYRKVSVLWAEYLKSINRRGE